LNVTYTPTTSGAATGSVSVASNAVGAPQVLGLSGIGVTASPVLAWLPAASSVAFGDITVGGNPTSKSFTLTNQGPGAVSLQQFTLVGAQASDFSLSAGSTCAVNSSLAAGASCTVVLAFQPAAAGARSATLQIAISGTNPADVVLSGNGTAPAMPNLLMSPQVLSGCALPAGLLHQPSRICFTRPALGCVWRRDRGLESGHANHTRLGGRREAGTLSATIQLALGRQGLTGYRPLHGQLLASGREQAFLKKVRFRKIEA
jgi:hypothetical protein